MAGVAGDLQDVHTLATIEVKAPIPGVNDEHLLAVNKAVKARGAEIFAKGLALMGQAKCAIAESNLPKARDLAQKALASNPTPSVAGAAHLCVEIREMEPQSIKFRLTI